MRRLVDLVLDALVLRARRRARGGERAWALAMVALWLVRRAHRDHHPVVWQGSLRSGQHLSVTVQPPTPKRRGRAR